jgi:hypothetical protein
VALAAPCTLTPKRPRLSTGPAVGPASCWSRAVFLSPPRWCCAGSGGCRGRRMRLTSTQPASNQRSSSACMPHVSLPFLSCSGTIWETTGHHHSTRAGGRCPLQTISQAVNAVKHQRVPPARAASPLSNPEPADLVLLRAMLLEHATSRAHGVLQPHHRNPHANESNVADARACLHPISLACHARPKSYAATTPSIVWFGMCPQANSSHIYTAIPCAGGFLQRMPDRLKLPRPSGATKGVMCRPPPQRSTSVKQGSTCQLPPTTPLRCEVKATSALLRASNHTP